MPCLASESQESVCLCRRFEKHIYAVGKQERIVTNKPSMKVISELHMRLAMMEAWLSSKPAIVTGVQGVRIMRIVALMSGNSFRYALVRTKRKGRWC